MRMVAILMALLFCSGCSPTIYDARVMVVSASDGHEIADAKVVVRRYVPGMFAPHPNFRSVQKGLTSSTGEFRMQLIDGERFDVSVSRPGFVAEERNFFPWTKKEHSDLIEFKLQPSPTPLESSVRDPSR